MLQRTVAVELLIRYYCESLGNSIQPIYLILQSRRRAEILEVAVSHVCEVDIPIGRVDGHVVDRVELPPVVVVHKL